MTGSGFGVSTTGADSTTGSAGFGAGVAGAAGAVLISIVGKAGGIKDGPTGAGGGGKMPFWFTSAFTTGVGLGITGAVGAVATAAGASISLVSVGASLTDEGT